MIDQGIATCFDRSRNLRRGMGGKILFYNLERPQWDLAIKEGENG